MVSSQSNNVSGVQLSDLILDGREYFSFLHSSEKSYVTDGETPLAVLKQIFFYSLFCQRNVMNDCPISPSGCVTPVSIPRHGLITSHNTTALTRRHFQVASSFTNWFHIGDDGPQMSEITTEPELPLKILSDVIVLSKSPT